LHSLSAPGIAGIVVGSVALTIALASVIILVVLRKRRMSRRHSPQLNMAFELPAEDQILYGNNPCPWPRRGIHYNGGEVGRPASIFQKSTETEQGITTAHLIQQHPISYYSAAPELYGVEVQRAELYSPPPALHPISRDFGTGINFNASPRTSQLSGGASEAQDSRTSFYNSINCPPSGFDSRMFQVPRSAGSHLYSLPDQISASATAFQPPPGYTGGGMITEQLAYGESGPILPATEGSDGWSGQENGYMLAGMEIDQDRSPLPAFNTNLSARRSC